MHPPLQGMGLGVTGRNTGLPTMLHELLGSMWSLTGMYDEVLVV